jgi:hypothetical protein
MGRKETLVKLVVPCLGTLDAADARLVQVAEFFGCKCELLHLEKGVAPSIEFMKKRVGDKDSCVVINPTVMQECLSTESFPKELAFALASQVSFVLLHNLSPDLFTTGTVNTFTAGALQSVHLIEGPGLRYDVASQYEHVCGPFSGLTFGPLDVANEHFVAKGSGDGNVRTYISVDGQPLFAGVQRDGAEVLVLAAGIADLDTQIGRKVLREFFPQIGPIAILLRYIFGQECWRPAQHHATFIVDDPLLRKNYGFLNYGRLLRLMDEFNFHTSIAFIPHNYLRNSRYTAQMFRERPDRFSICVHGNDHTAAEFASKDSGLLNSMLAEAEERLEVLHTRTGIPCDRVMVFPQGHFSTDAMKVLKAHNFFAAVNSDPYPLGEHAGLALADLLQPAILKYGGFPLFLREYVGEMTSQDVALYLFFGKPVLIMEHHEFFKDSKCLPEVVSNINTLAPKVRWSNLRTAIQNSYLVRKTPHGPLHVRAYANAGSIKNDCANPLVCNVNWPGSTESTVKDVLVDGVSWPSKCADGGSVNIFCELPPQSSLTFLLVQENGFGLSQENRRLKWKAKAFLRRRLSEVRDNYLSKSTPLLTAAQTLQRRLWKRPT